MRSKHLSSPQTKILNFEPVQMLLRSKVVMFHSTNPGGDGGAVLPLDVLALVLVLLPLLEMRI